MTSITLANVLAAAGESGMTEIELPVPPLAYGAVTFLIFMSLLAITYSFKNVAARR